MRRLFRILPAYFLLAACGGGAGSSSPPQDAASETGEPDAESDGGSCFPFCGSADAGSPRVDASGLDAPSCDQLKAAYEALQGPAQACDPQLQAQCAATTNGPCCPVAVTASSQAAVDNFDQAVAAYVAACSPDCSMIICMPTPLSQCQALAGGPSQGRCQ
jgi:hypothetical protein